MTSPACTRKSIHNIVMHLVLRRWTFVLVWWKQKLVTGGKLPTVEKVAACKYTILLLL